MANRYTQSRWIAAIFMFLASGPTACTAPAPAPDFHSTDARARIRAIQQAAATDDRSSIPDLIDRLASDDPAERLLSIRTLERMTGQTLGYEHSGSRAERDQSVARWVAWYQSSKGRPTPAASTPGDTLMNPHPPAGQG